MHSRNDESLGMHGGLQGMREIQEPMEKNEKLG